MPADQPRFVVVPVEPSEEMLRACYGAISKCITGAVNDGSAPGRWKTSGKGFKLTPREKSKTRWSEMLAARGPSAEAMVAVPKGWVRKFMALAYDAGDQKLAAAIRALLTPSQEGNVRDCKPIPR